MSEINYGTENVPLASAILLESIAKDAAAHFKLNGTPGSQPATLVSGKVHITPDHNIARFLARSFTTSIYESNPQAAYGIDRWIDLATSKAFPEDALNIVKEGLAKKTFLLGGDSYTLADVVVWSVVATNPKIRTNVIGDQLAGKWFSRLSALPEFSQAAQKLNVSLKAEAKAEKQGQDKKPQQAQKAEAPIVVDRSGFGYFKAYVAEAIASISDFTMEQIYSLLEAPKVAEHGDVALPLPRLAQSKKIQGNPAALAAEWASKCPKGDLITTINPIGPFLNFKFDKTRLVSQVLTEIYERKEKFGHSNIGAGKTVVVEFSSPNIAKPFHAGHLRSTIIGNFIANVKEAMGFKTIKINYLGDWGKQYGLLALGFIKSGSEEELEKDPIKHLFDIYVKVNEEAKKDPTVHDQARAYFKRMEEGEPEALNLWRRFRDLSIEKYKKIYARLNINFDIYSGESMFEEGMKEEMKRLEELGLLKESQGAHVVDLKDFGLGVVVVRKSDGTTLYITRDIAAATFRQREYNFDQMYYVVASQQDMHFKQLFKTLELAGYPWASTLTHIGFGFVAGMSTRKGNVVFLEDILDEAKRVMYQVMEKNEEKFKQIEDPDYVSDIVGLSAVLVQDMSARRLKDYDFSWDRMTSFEGDTGPYLQFAHSRLCSIQRRSGIVLTGKEDLSLLTEDVGVQLAQLLARYPEVLQNAHTHLEPCVIVSYAMTLSHHISLTLESMWVLHTEANLAAARMRLYDAARTVLASCMRTIGLIPLERM